MSDNKAAPIVPAATIMMLRDGTEGLEIFMVVRHHQIDFASGALVFPGGKADPNDFADELNAYVQGASDDDNMRAIQVAAIREAFEECGILLARPQGSTDLIDAGRLKTLEPYREALNNGELSILEFLTNEKLVLACDELTHYAHWVTPDMMPKRFDTHFFLANAPADHLAVHDGYESVDSIWITPQQALQDAEAGTRTVIFPTLRNIEKAGHFTSAADAIERTRASKVVKVLPVIEKRDDGNYLCIPTEAGYDVSEEKMPERKK